MGSSTGFSAFATAGNQSTTLNPRLFAFRVARTRSPLGLSRCHADLLHACVSGVGARSCGRCTVAVPSGETLMMRGAPGAEFGASGGRVRCEAVSSLRGGAVGGGAAGTPAPSGPACAGNCGTASGLGKRVVGVARAADGWRVGLSVKANGRWCWCRCRNHLRCASGRQPRKKSLQSLLDISKGCRAQYLLSSEIGDTSHWAAPKGIRPLQSVGGVSFPTAGFLR